MDFTYPLLILLILFICGPWLWRYHIRPYFAKSAIYQQLKNFPDGQRLKKTERLLLTLYRGVNSRGVSRRERKRLGINDDAFIYGEIEFLSFFIILDKVKPQPGEVFYDLGSGAGKAVFTAALSFDLSKVYGIEWLPGLCQLANTQIKKAKTLVRLHDKYFLDTYLRRLSSIQFINDNFLNYDFSDGDILFINATCLGYLAWQNLVEQFTHLKCGSRIIVTSKKIQHEQFKVIYQGVELMSWGMNSVNIYVKV